MPTIQDVALEVGKPDGAGARYFRVIVRTGYGVRRVAAETLVLSDEKSAIRMIAGVAAILRGRAVPEPDET